MTADTHHDRAWDQPLTMAEKLISRAVGDRVCRAGDQVQPDPRWVIVHDGYVQTAYKELSALGYRRITHPERVALVTDHDVIYVSPRVAEKARANRTIAQAWQVGHFSDVGQNGHGHLFPMENGMVVPGAFVIAYDMHCSTFGALGAYALASGNETTVVLATGRLLFEVPQSVRVRLRGQLPPGSHARDLGFHLGHLLTSNQAGIEYDSRVFEFCGDGAERMTLASRVGLCNTLTEIGAAHVLFPPMHFDGRPAPECESLRGDEAAHYEARLDLPLSDLAPQVALPGSPDRAAPIDQVVGRPIDHAYLGSCGSSMYEDMASAALLLRDRKLAPGVRMVVVPGTTRIARQLADEGLMQIFMDAGATLLPPGCGPCAGGRSGLLAAGEVSISTAATNTAGRMGDPSAQAYLGSPLTVAASAIAGALCDPRQYATELARLH